MSFSGGEDTTDIIVGQGRAPRERGGRGEGGGRANEGVHANLRLDESINGLRCWDPLGGDPSCGKCKMCSLSTVVFRSTANAY